MLIGQLLEKMGVRPKLSIEEDISIHEALVVMANMNVGALLVQREQEIVGIFSERDYARKVILKGRSSAEANVADVMTRNVIFANYNMPVEKCLETMAKNGVRHLPVVSDGICVGFISIIEVVDELLSSRDFMIDQLNKFIAGSQFVTRLTVPVNLSEAC